MVLGLIISILYLFTDFFYWLKWAASVIALRLWRRRHRRKFDLYKYDDDNQPEKLGILIPPEEKILEAPFPEEHLQNAADEIFVYGVNSKSESLVIRLNRAPNDEAEAWIYLKLKDGRWYELQERAGYQRNYGGKCTSFTCGGLQMYYLSPMRRWRILYCGMLRERTKHNENKQRNEVFVKFTFIWKASSDVFDSSADVDIRAAAKAMANAKWTSIIPPVDKMVEVLNFYCQSGEISGTVSIADEPEAEMYLFGERIRHLGKSSHLVGAKFKHILGVIHASGLVVHFGRASVPNTFQNLNFGYIVHPDSFIRIIEDGQIISRLSDHADSEDLTATFEAEKLYELHGNFADDVVRLTNEKGWSGRLNLTGIDFEIAGLNGTGFMMAGEIIEMPEVKSKKATDRLPVAKPLTVYFTDDTSHSPDLSGGKGASLGMLSKLSSDNKSEFVVPKGIVVTTAAYNEFLTPDLITEINKLKDIAYGNICGNTQEACEIVKTAVAQADLPDKICRDIEQKLQRIFEGNLDQFKVAVRSSATGEDSDQMSAAGQMTTLLGVTGLKEIFKAVKKCWASQFSYTATEYKRQNGQIIDSPMAVVIQEMVECEAAGVLFTCDPVTNNPSFIAITGNYGLGESVVSGTEEPDTIVLKKLSRNEVEIKSVTIGLKQHKIVMKDINSGEDRNTVITENIPENERNECCISRQMAETLGKLSLKIEEYFKSPRDLEWGIKGQTIYILQSRPITTGAAASDYEIKHEFDGPLRAEGSFYTLCNVGEVLPGAASPLGLDIILKYFSAVLGKAMMKGGERDNFLGHEYFASGMLPFYNHMTLSVLDILTRESDLDSLEAQAWMVSIFGRILDDPELKTLAQYKETKKKNPSLKLYIGLLWNLFFSGYGIEEIKKKTFDYQVSAENGRTATETFNILMHSYSHYAKPCITHIICSTMSNVWNMYMLATLRSSKGCIDADVYNDFAKMLATSKNVESADVPSSIKELANCIIKDVKGEDFKSMTLEEAIEWLKTSTGMAGAQYRQFIERHGHRCLKESDVYSIPWRQDPRTLIKLIQNIVCSGKEIAEKQEDDPSTILSKLTVPMTLKTKLLLKFLMPNCRRGVREREACKSILIKSTDNIRKGFKHFSQLMVAEGYLPDDDLMYFLTIGEIQDLLETRNSRLISRAIHRRRLFPTLDSYMFPDIWKGLAIPNNEQNNAEIEYVADLVMKGIPVSQGTVKGYARVALSLEEASHLKRGEVLITYSTDIGWSPYFPILAGVVTELGGLLSHGAVVSREYGLPCVVGIHLATKMFRTGDFVLLDGNKGILQRLAVPEHS